MIFTTYWFQVFAIVTVAVYWLLGRQGPRLWFLGLACLLFHYHFAGPAGMAPIIVLMIIAYFAGLSRSRAACGAAMVPVRGGALFLQVRDVPDRSGGGTLQRGRRRPNSACRGLGSTEFAPSRHQFLHL